MIILIGWDRMMSLGECWALDYNRDYNRDPTPSRNVAERRFHAHPTPSPTIRSPYYGRCNRIVRAALFQLS